MENWLESQLHQKLEIKRAKFRTKRNLAMALRYGEKDRELKEFTGTTSVFLVVPDESEVHFRSWCCHQIC